MSFILPPKILQNLKLVYDPIKFEWKLPDSATEEQKKALKEYDKKVERAQRNMCIIEGPLPPEVEAVFKDTPPRRVKKAAIS